uniref:DUF4806 domain-containing protein n=1 Tax=Knipowitschia caucasica TaxID=637954 RepID=A0AAV2KJ33_KNICA
MEAWIRGTNMELKQQVINKLSAIGGQDHKKVTWNILACIFNDSCAQKISWKGVHGKIPFKSMALKTLILEAVKRNNLCRTITDVEIFFSLAVLHIMKMEHDSSSCVLAETGTLSQGHLEWLCCTTFDSDAVKRGKPLLEHDRPN